MAIKEKNKILEVNALEIPDELIELPKWVLWRGSRNNSYMEKYLIAMLDIKRVLLIVIHGLF